MITKQQVTLMSKERLKGTLQRAAAKAGMSETTARKYKKLLESGKPLPQDEKPSRSYSTRQDPGSVRNFVFIE